MRGNHLLVAQFMNKQREIEHSSKVGKQEDHGSCLMIKMQECGAPTALHIITKLDAYSNTAEHLFMELKQLNICH